MRNGKGLYVFKNGARYDGEWRRAMKYGVGKMLYPDGSWYEGDWRHDLKQGFGAYYYPNGDIYEGAWFKGRRHGLGTYFFAEFQLKFMGTWLEGVIVGPGQIIYPRARYHGSWIKGKPKGPEFLPPEAVPLPVHDSLPSLTDESIVTDIMHFEPPCVEAEHEGGDDNDSWLMHRQQFLEETQKEQKEAEE
ncbi:putative testis-specific protein A2, partial [Operophtera brumata]